jgi:protein SCO1/2
MLRGRLSLLFLLLCFGVLFTSCDATSAPWNGTVYAEPQIEPSFTLQGAGGQNVTLRDFRGKVVLLYFGYTFCPDICPTTMADLKRVEDGLADNSGVQVIMISVDPARDTPQIIATYARSFHPSFIGLTGSDAELAAAADPFGVYFAAQEGTEATGYLVDHTARIFVVDRDGKLRLSYSYGTPPADIVADVERLLQESSM